MPRKYGVIERFLTWLLGSKARNSPESPETTVKQCQQCRLWEVMVSTFETIHGTPPELDEAEPTKTAEQLEWEELERRALELS